MDQSGTQREGIGDLLLEAQDVLVLVHRLQALVGDGLRVLADAELVVQVADVATVVVVRDQGQAGRRPGHRIHAGVGVELLAVQRLRGTTHRHGGGQRQRVTAGVAVHLEGGITVHVPAEAQARGELVLDFGEGFAVTIHVLEVVPAQAEIGDEVVGDVPAVFDVERGLVDGDGGTGLEHALADDAVLIGDAGCTVAAVTPDDAAGVRLTCNRLEVVDVDAGAQQVGTQLPFRVDAELVAGVLGVRTTEDAGDLAANAARNDIVHGGRASTMTGQPLAGTPTVPRYSLTTPLAATEQLPRADSVVPASTDRVKLSVR